MVRPANQRTVIHRDDKSEWLPEESALARRRASGCRPKPSLVLVGMGFRFVPLADPTRFQATDSNAAETVISDVEGMML
jgi:hypothetical protein